MNRRQFVTESSLTLSGLSTLSLLHRTSLFQNKSEIFFHATNWGFPGNLEAFCTSSKKEGYDGVEIWLMPAEDRSLFQQLMEKQQLRPALLVGAWSSDFQTHLADYKRNLMAAVDLKPHFINCHAGKDYFTFEQNRAIAEFAIETSNSSGIPVYQETHRGRMFFAAHVTRKFLEEIPQIRLTLDISHWCNVHESLLQDQQEAVALALKHTDHIHARVGHAEGPQVAQPEAPEWKSATDAHLGWWDQVVHRLLEKDHPITITPEFGPPTYMPTIPYTGQPLADNWKVNVEMMQLLRSRYH